MIGLGTIINSACIVMGGVSGLLFGKLLKERYQESLRQHRTFSEKSVTAKRIFCGANPSPDPHREAHLLRRTGRAYQPGAGSPMRTSC